MNEENVMIVPSNVDNGSIDCRVPLIPGPANEPSTAGKVASSLCKQKKNIGYKYSHS